jgi:hypothetical protein
MLDNNQQNFQLNAMLIKHWNQEMNDKYLFHLSLDFFVHNHQVLKSKLLKMYLLNLVDFKLEGRDRSNIYFLSDTQELIPTRESIRIFFLPLV